MQLLVVCGVTGIRLECGCGWDRFLSSQIAYDELVELVAEHETVRH